jgi:hypothetical protein
VVHVTARNQRYVGTMRSCHDVLRTGDDFSQPLALDCGRDTVVGDAVSFHVS